MSTFLYRVYVADLLLLLGRSVEAAVGRPNTLSSVSDSFQKFSTRFSGGGPQLPELLRRLCQWEVDKKCGECNSLRTTFSERWLTKRPKTFVASLVWPTPTPTRDAIWAILATVSPKLAMDQIFRTERSSQAQTTSSASTEASRNWAQTLEWHDSVASVGATGWAAHASTVGPLPAEASREDPYLFRGLICYYGMHYIAVFWCLSRRRWIIFDDHRVVHELDWSGVANFITTGQYVPTLLFYEDCDKFMPLGRSRSIEELERQVRELEDRQAACTTM